MENTNTQKKILMVETVEDDASLRQILHKKLSLEGYGIIEARNGQEGFEIALREKPDLILSDIMMPGVDGMSMMHQLRQANEWGKNVPIILLTNLNSDDDSRIRAIAEDQPAYYLVKAQSSIADIMEKIRERLGRGV